jgi:hypothetical protein
VANTEGCNDTLRLNLTINNGSLTETTETACETFTWTAGNGTTYTASGVYDHIVANTEGCNDTLRLNLTINNGSLTEVTETACETFTWTAGNGTTYTASGVYDHIVVNAEWLQRYPPPQPDHQQRFAYRSTRNRLRNIYLDCRKRADLYRFGRV